MSDADRIVAKDDIIRILKNGESSNAEVSSNTPSVELEIVRSVGTHLTLGLRHKAASAAPTLDTAGVFTEGEKIEIVFSLIDGQYAIRDEVRSRTPTTFDVDAADGMLRLQRRKDFRVAVTRGAMRFIWNAQATGGSDAASSISFELIDLSAGGLRLLWPPNAGAIPRVGEKLTGDLVLKFGPPPETLAVRLEFVKDHGADAPLKPELGDALSFKFEGLSQDDSRAILFACLAVYRNSYGSR